jgi:hypothetical protein
MKIKLSMSRTEGIALLSAVLNCNRFYNWAYGITVIRNPNNTVSKIILHAQDGNTPKKFTLTPEVLMRGANLAIQPEADINRTIKDTIQSGDFMAVDLILDIIVQFGLFGQYVYKDKVRS